LGAMPYAKTFLKHALSITYTNDNLNYGVNSAIAKDLGKNKDVEQSISKALIKKITEYKKKKRQTNTLFFTAYHEFTSKYDDYHYAFGKVSISITAKAKNINSKSWSINAKLIDHYDFNKFRKGSSLANDLNNNGRAAQLLGVLKTYYVYVDFTKTIKIK
ncbi:MAG: hypothetical protein VB122_08675, partial [Erysipelotrichales bacterium]|nr:hypothetical protein [Erysipelotrichales bacterium]